MINYFPINYLKECFILDRRMKKKTGKKIEIDIALKKIQNLQKKINQKWFKFLSLVIPDKSTQYHNYFEEKFKSTSQF